MDYKALMRTRLTDLFRKDPVYLALIDAVGDLLNDKLSEIEQFQSSMYNLETSVGPQLDMIGAIVGQPRQLLNVDTGIYFGFEEAPYSETFGTITDPNIGGNWRSILNNPTSITVKKLDDETYRLLIKARIITNHSNGHAKDFLKVINLLEGNTLTRIDGTTVVIRGPIKPLTSYLLDKRTEVGSIFPIPLGVKLNIVEI